jgi:hypothetical protein
MRVLLISVNRERDPYPVAPLGLAYVAAALRATHPEPGMDGRTAKPWEQAR